MSVRASRSRSQRLCGFTLTDVMITVLILGILAAVAAPKYADSLQRCQVEAAARRIAADLQYARQQAKQKGTPQSVIFTVASSSYALPLLNDIDRASTPFTVDLTASGYSATLVSASFAGGSGTIVFDMYGRPDSGGSAVVQVADEQRTIVVDGVSGRVSVQP